MVFTLRGVESGRIFVLKFQLRSKNAILCVDVCVPPPPSVPLLPSPSRAISLSFPFGTPDMQDSQILVIASGIENKT